MNKKKLDALKNKLSFEQYNICFLKGTEPPFSGRYTHNKKNGIYFCVVCDSPLFSSKDKFDSGTGWPSFDKVICNKNVKTKIDDSLGMRRLEILCSACGAHLGYVFDDGPTETGKRYCINSLALDFRKD